MPSGSLISFDMRRLIVNQLNKCGVTITEAYNNLISEIDGIYTKKSFENLGRRIRAMNQDEKENYVNNGLICGRPLAGRKRVYGEAVQNILCEIRINNNTACLSKFANIY